MNTAFTLEMALMSSKAACALMALFAATSIHAAPARVESVGTNCIAGAILICVFGILVSTSFGIKGGRK